MKKVPIEIENLLFIYYYLHPNMTGKRIWSVWERSNIFKEYDKPDVNQLVIIVDGFKQEIIDQRNNSVMKQT